VLRIFGPKRKERDRWEDQGVDGWAVLKWILERWDGMDWIDMAQDRDQWRALVNTEPSGSI
jgi:hypothetical protein